MSRSTQFVIIAALLIASISVLILVAGNSIVNSADEKMIAEMRGVQDYIVIDKQVLTSSPDDGNVYMLIDNPTSDSTQITVWPDDGTGISTAYIVNHDENKGPIGIYYVEAVETGAKPYVEILQGVDIHGETIDNAYAYRFHMPDISDTDFNEEYFANLNDDQRAAYTAYDELSDEDKALADKHGWATIDGVAIPLDENGEPIR